MLMCGPVLVGFVLWVVTCMGMVLIKKFIVQLFRGSCSSRRQVGLAVKGWMWRGMPAEMVR